MDYKISIIKNGDGTLFLSLYINSKRHRFYSGKPIGIASSPNKLSVSERKAAFEDLKLDYQLASQALPQLTNLKYTSEPSASLVTDTIFHAGDTLFNGSLNAAMESGRLAAEGFIEKKSGWFR